FQVAFGPTPNGKWPKETVEWLNYTGDWLKVNGEAIYKSRAWTYDSEGENIRFTRSKDGKYVYAIATQWPGEKLRLKKVRSASESEIIMLGYKGASGSQPLKWSQDENGLVIDIPEELQDPERRPCVQAWVFRIQVGPGGFTAESGTGANR
ncbi:MAG: alpha-L-fucosidase C-terminal domain-containing protein, partial [Planctomycetota bacterium]